MIPVIETAALVLRPFDAGDAETVRKLAGDKAVARTTLNIPHPYERGVAEAWIVRHAEEFDSGRAMTLAVTERDGGRLVGAVGVTFCNAHDNGELGYWIGRPFWNRGYCTEAAEAVIKYCFEELGLHRIYARHLGSNPASGRVMQKIGMKMEGVMRGHLKKWGSYEDVMIYGIMKDEF